MRSVQLRRYAGRRSAWRGGYAELTIGNMYVGTAVPRGAGTQCVVKEMYGMRAHRGAPGRTVHERDPDATDIRKVTCRYA